MPAFSVERGFDWAGVVECVGPICSRPTARGRGEQKGQAYYVKNPLVAPELNTRVKCDANATGRRERQGGDSLPPLAAVRGTRGAVHAR